MLGLYRYLGIFALIPTAILLAISFFVLVVGRKLDLTALKAFGAVIAVLLWIAAALVFSTGVYSIVSGRCPVMSMMSGMPHMMMRQGTGMMLGNETMPQMKHMK